MPHPVQVLFNNARVHRQNAPHVKRGGRRHGDRVSNAHSRGYRHFCLLRPGRCPSGNNNPLRERQINSPSWPAPRNRRPGIFLPCCFARTLWLRVRSFLLSMAGKQFDYDSTLSASIEPSQLGRSSCTPDIAHPASFTSFCRYGQRRTSPFFTIDSHPVDVCCPVRAGKKKQLSELARKGYYASLKRWYHGVCARLIFTPEGRITFVIQIAGNRHDVNGLYVLLKTSFQGHPLKEQDLLNVRRLAKNITLNLSLHRNDKLDIQKESVMHYQLAA